MGFSDLAADILALGQARGVMIATAESCTAGLLSAALTDLPGSSNVFERGFVTYTNAAKVEMLGVSQATLEAVGAVSQEIAAQMAAGALAHSHAQLSVAITGIAGPGGSEHKPEGRVCFGLAMAGHTQAHTVEFGPLGRDAVRVAARDHALEMLINALRDLPVT